METDIHIKIESYLDGSMSPKDQQIFEQELLSDDELQKEVNLYRSINHHLNEESWEPICDSTENKKELEAYFNSDEAKELKQKLKTVQKRYNEPRKNYFLKYGIAAAAILLVVTISYFSLKQKSYEDLYVEFYNEKDLPSFVTRGNSTGVLSTGVIAYKENKYKDALQLFDDYIINSTTLDPLVYSYKGMCHMELNEFKKAIQSFDQLINSNSIDNSKGLWYKCLVYLKTKDLSNLKATLHTIRKKSDNYNYTKAQKLLESL